MTARAVRAITAGKASVTIGPLVTLEINTDLSSYKIGDRIPRQDQRSEYRLHAAADFSERSDGRKCHISQMTYKELSELQFQVSHKNYSETIRLFKLEEMLP